MALRGLTDNEKAANGPLSGDHSLVAEEHRGSASIASPGYYPSLNGAEIAEGRILAESDYFEPLSPGSLITPGYGGRVYFPTAKGFLTLQVRPAP